MGGNQNVMSLSVQSWTPPVLKHPKVFVLPFFTNETHKPNILYHSTSNGQVEQFSLPSFFFFRFIGFVTVGLCWLFGLPSPLNRMQFIFLYYDQNRNGRLEVEEVATMIEHIQQLHGESHKSAMVDAKVPRPIYRWVLLV